MALPYFSRSRLSSEPALTPIRIEVPRSLAAARDLLDLVVELADVAGVDPDGGAAGVDRGEDVLRLEVDVGDDRDLRLAGRCSAARRRRPGSGTATRTMSQPEAVSSAICWRVALMSVVERRGHRLHRDRAVAADPDLADLDLAGLAAGGEHRRGRRGHAEADAVMAPVSGVTGGRREPAGRGSASDRIGTTRSPTISTTPITSSTDGHDVRDRQQLGDVDVPGVGPAAQPGDAAPDRLPQRAGDVAAVERAAAG